VVGLCALGKIQISGFTAISCVVSTGLAVEYAVHITHRFLLSPQGSGKERIDASMQWLFTPNALAFLTSMVGVLMMALSKFKFVRIQFFEPLCCAVGISYFFGGIALPCLLGCMSFVPALTTSGAGVESGLEEAAAEEKVQAASAQDVEPAPAKPTLLDSSQDKQPGQESCGDSKLDSV
jgi:hypothetical protein